MLRVPWVSTAQESLNSRSASAPQEPTVSVCTVLLLSQVQALR